MGGEIESGRTEKKIERMERKKEDVKEESDRERSGRKINDGVVSINGASM